VLLLTKTIFIKECGLYCSKCKNTGHFDKDCTGSKIKYDFIDSSYVLVKSSKGDVYSKFVGKNKNHAYIPNNCIGIKKRSIWVSKDLVINLQGFKQVWISKRN
jgi:secreted trypsin-like serine protease